MGPQGSGKSTQATILAKKLHLPHIETGEIYRSLENTDSSIGRKIKAALDKGGLVDDETTFEIIDQHLSEMRSGFVIDGFPRTLAQAKRDLFSIDAVIFLRLSNEEATKRLLLRGREDDTPELISERLKLYHEQTEPILNYYKEKQKLIEINGEKTIDEISKDISREIDKITKQ
jgi:adenylate kinase